MATTVDKPLVWFITGCSSGFGRSLAQHVLQRGHTCVVTARDASQVTDIAATSPDRSQVLALDVTSPASIKDAVAKAEARFGGIDVLVNNAGYGYYAAIEEGEDQEVRAMFDANFFGLAAVIRQVLPGMRARRHGHIINISSVAGLLSNPSSGYYSASKYAVEGLSEGLAKEVAEHGIRVTLIEPGPFRTNFHGRSSRTTKTPIDAYANTAIARRTQLNAAAGKQPGDPDRAAPLIIQVAESADPPMRLVLGKMALSRAREQINAVQASLEKSKDISPTADFPDA